MKFLLNLFRKREEVFSCPCCGWQGQGKAIVQHSLWECAADPSNLFGTTEEKMGIIAALDSR